MTIARYFMNIGDNGAGPSVYPETVPDGDWVDYEDHVKAMVAAARERDRLRDALREALDLAEPYAARMKDEARARKDVVGERNHLGVKLEFARLRSLLETGGGS